MINHLVNSLTSSHGNVGFLPLKALSLEGLFNYSEIVFRA